MEHCLYISMLQPSLLGEDGDDSDSRIGYHIGAVMDWTVAKNLYVQPGIYFTTRGTKEGGTEGQYELSSNPYFGSVRFPVTEKLMIDINAGPYFAMGIGGK